MRLKFDVIFKVHTVLVSFPLIDLLGRRMVVMSGARFDGDISFCAGCEVLYSRFHRLEARPVTK